MKKILLLLLPILISACGDHRSFQQRKSNLMYDCQCDPGTNNYSYELASILIEEQEATIEYINDNKDYIKKCTKATNDDINNFIEKIEENIDHNKKERPYFLTKILAGDSTVFDIKNYKETKFDLLKKSIDSCNQIK